MNFPIIRYMPAWPSRRIVKVKVDKCKDRNAPYAFTITTLEPSVKLVNEHISYSDSWLEDGFHVASLEGQTLYVSRKQGEKDQLEKVHTEYAQLRRDLRTAQKKYKWGLKMVAEYKKFKQLQNPFFVA